MNNVNRPIALTTAHKLRSAAAAILADAAKQADARLADSLMCEAGQIHARADSIEEQAKPAIEEPQEFGSMVLAFTCGRDREYWVRTMTGQFSVWTNNAGTTASWSRLCEPEVLRVGIGDPSAAEWSRLDGANADSDAYAKGVEAFRTAAHGQLQLLFAEAITGERKNAYLKAIALVEGLQP